MSLNDSPFDNVRSVAIETDTIGNTHSERRAKTFRAALRRSRSNFEQVYGFHIFVIVLGVIASVCLIPTTVADSTGLRIPACVLSVSLLSGTLLQASNFGLRYGLATEWLLSFGIIYYVLLDLITARYVVPASRHTIVLSFIAIGVFAVGAALGCLITGRRVPAALRLLQGRDYGPNALFPIILGCSGLGLFYYFFMAGFSPQRTLAGLLESRTEAPWSRGALGDWNALYEHLMYFGYLVPSFTVMLGLRLKRWSDPRVLVALGLSAVILTFVAQSGGRRMVGVICGSAILVYAAASINRIKIRNIAIIAISLMAVLAAMEFMLNNRDTGLKNYEFTTEGFDAIRVDDNFFRLTQIMDIFPEDLPYVGSHFLVYVLIRPLPRALWPGKPVDPGFELHTYLGHRDVTFSISSIAEWYYSYGWVGVLTGGLLFGCLARVFSNVRDTSRTLTGFVIYGLGTMMIIAGVRSLFDLVLMSYPLLFWMSIEYTRDITRKRKRIRRSHYEVQAQ